MSRPNKAEKPQRSCLGCRETRDRDALIRFVLSPQNEVVPDLDGRLPGRGAYTCVNAECLKKAIRQRQFNRAFKTEVTVSGPDDMTGQVAAVIRERILGYLGLANKAGKIISGGSLVSDALKSASKPGLVLIATDISRDIGEKIEVLAGYHRITSLRVLTKDDLGSILGKAPRSAVAVRPGGFVPRLINEIQRYRNFLGEVQVQ